MKDGRDTFFPGAKHQYITYRAARVYHREQLILCDNKRKGKFGDRRSPSRTRWQENRMQAGRDPAIRPG
jgi:hypothetical protein